MEGTLADDSGGGQTAPQWSADRQWWWDGTKWIPAADVGPAAIGAKVTEPNPTKDSDSVQPSSDGHSADGAAPYFVVPGGLAVSRGGHWWWGGRWNTFLKNPSEPKPSVNGPKHALADAANSLRTASDLMKKVKQAGTINPVLEALAPVMDANQRSESTRRETYEAIKRDCPLQITFDLPPPIGGASGIRLFEDEFLVSAAKDWGFSSQRLTLTTHRLIYSHGRLSKAFESMYLQDIRDVEYVKPILNMASLRVETASGITSIEGLPAMYDGRKIRDEILAMVHYARKRAGAPTVLRLEAQAAADDIPAKLKQLKELHDAGLITEAEFEAKKTELLARF